MGKRDRNVQSSIEAAAKGRLDCRASRVNSDSELLRGSVSALAALKSIAIPHFGYMKNVPILTPLLPAAVQEPLGVR